MRRLTLSTLGILLVGGVGIAPLSSEAAKDLTDSTASRAAETNGLVFALMAGSFEFAQPAAGSAMLRLGDSPAWVLDGTQGDSYLGLSAATAGDVNGDGYSDLLVGIPYFDNPMTDAGRVELHLGGPVGPGPVAWVFEGDQPDAAFGYSMAAVGDVNGDGFDDFVVSEPFYDGVAVDCGRVSLFLGTPTGPQSPPIWRYEGTQESGRLGYAVASAGDTNGDGYPDVLVGEPLYDGAVSDQGRVLLFLGGPGGPTASPDWEFTDPARAGNLGHSVAGAGDVNGDGYDDVLLGAPFATDAYTMQGVAYLFLGGSGGPVSDPTWESAGAMFRSRLGFSVSGGGDVDGDGYSDFVVGEPRFGEALSHRGRALLFLGAASGPASVPDWVYVGEAPDAEAGSGVLLPGDVNGDGYADVAVGAPGESDGEGLPQAGCVRVFLGSAGGLGNSPIWITRGAQSGAAIGLAMGPAGDLDGNGVGELLVNIPEWNGEGPSTGRVEVYRGQVDFLSATWNWSPQEATWPLAGCAGDVNGDGFSDLLVSATAGLGAQAAALFQGGESGLTPQAVWNATNYQNNSWLGYSQTGARDVNADGYSDIAVGAPLWDANNMIDIGAVLVWYGSSTGLEANPRQVLTGPSAYSSFGKSVSDAGDVNDDGYGDLVVGSQIGGSFNGRAYLYLGSTNGLLEVPLEIQPGGSVRMGFGRVVESAGDVNGDGHSDVLVSSGAWSGLASTGAVDLYLGTDTGVASTPSWSAVGYERYGDFGYTICGAGDVNGDGYGDVLVGAARESNGQYVEAGRVYLYLGGPAGLSGSPAWIYQGEITHVRAGKGLAPAGDVDGDGFDDVVIVRGAAPAVVLFRGTPTGLETSPSWSSDIVTDSARGCGDVNGDGRGDIAVGGSPFVFLAGARELSGGGFSTPRSTVALQRGVAGAPIDLLGVADSYDRFRLGSRGWGPRGRGDVRLEWQIAPVGTPLSSGVHGLGNWVDSGPVVGPGGSAVSLETQVSALTPMASYHWRVRTRRADPVHPYAPWSCGGRASWSTKQLRMNEMPAEVIDPTLENETIRCGAAPCPASSACTVSFSLTRGGPISVSLFDVLGRRTREIVNGSLAAGAYSRLWDGRDDQGRMAPTGIYLLKVVTPAGWSSARVVLVR
jgi:hypothetical protein